MGLEILPKTIALTPLDLNPIGLTQPPFVQVLGWDLGPYKIRDFLSSQMSATHSGVYTSPCFDFTPLLA